MQGKRQTPLTLGLTSFARPSPLNEGRGDYARQVQLILWIE